MHREHAERGGSSCTRNAFEVSPPSTRKPRSAVRSVRTITRASPDFRSGTSFGVAVRQLDAIGSVLLQRRGCRLLQRVERRLLAALFDDDVQLGEAPSGRVNEQIQGTSATDDRRRLIDLNLRGTAAAFPPPGACATDDEHKKKDGQDTFHVVAIVGRRGRRAEGIRVSRMPISASLAA